MCLKTHLRNHKIMYHITIAPLLQQSHDNILLNESNTSHIKKVMTIYKAELSTS